ncbi:MAG: sodium:solute symporter [Bacteroidetes bacterium]|nr:MAG: sodium:solute symporter [Bacteroidota bacterium]
MSPTLIISCITGYFGFLLLIAWYTSRNANNQSYFLANKAAPWYAVAFGMISDSLSGVTFISVPGSVGFAHFSYLQVILGYFFGYFFIANVLLPLYYNRNLTSIYSYLLERFGKFSQKTGSFFFLLSRMLGAAARLYLTASVIQLFVFDAMGVPFWLSVSIIIALILLYTYKGGIKTLVWTDTFQSAFLLLGVALSIAAISHEMGFGIKDMFNAVANSNMTQTFFWEWQEKSFFPKQFIGGIFIAVAMTGLDQNMMQKNLSCRSLGDAQKNIRWFSLVMVIVNVFFLSLGVLLYMYANAKGVTVARTDFLFPTLALDHLGAFAGIVFIVGLTAATFSSADSVLTTLTTSFMIDFHLTSTSASEENVKRIRHLTHIGFAVILLVVILLFRVMNKQAIIDTVLQLAGYTYGPLLGLFFFGIFTKRSVIDKLVPVVCLLAPVVCYFLDANSKELFNGYLFGNELLIVNGLLTFLGLSAITKKN